MYQTYDITHVLKIGYNNNLQYALHL
ncbi:hypothetical protein ACT453_52400 [Bacillus sp. D-CC]